MARRDTEVMSLEWHLEQREARDSLLTHHAMDSERIDSVNENIYGSIHGSWKRREEEINCRGRQKSFRLILIMNIS